jgi:hypothetical protein
MSFLHSEEPTYQFTFGSNLKLFPIQFNRTNKDVKTPVSIKLNKWIVSPTTSSFTGNNLLTGLSKSKNNKDKIYFKLKIKF